jgi:hypothetical protein
MTTNALEKMLECVLAKLWPATEFVTCFTRRFHDTFFRHTSIHVFPKISFI